MRDTLFAGRRSIALANLAYRGKRISVRVTLPPEGTAGGVFEVASVRLNGSEIGTAEVASADLPAESLFEVTLTAGPSSAPITKLEGSGLADYKNLFGPRTPSINGLALNSNRVELSLGTGGESGADIRYRIYRDGVQIAENVPGTSTVFLDSGSAAHATKTYCYSVESEFVSSGTASQHSRPACYWGPASSRIQSFPAQSFSSNGGTLVFNHGRWHYENWGDPGHTLTVENVNPLSTGKHWLQVVAGNGAGGYTTGITCGVKAIEVYDGPTLVARRELVMPHLGSWSDWRDSNLVSVDLQAGKSYSLVIRESQGSGNMSDLDHFSLYGGTGGTGGRFNRVNIAELKLLSAGTP